jgi:hypothetical protein
VVERRELDRSQSPAQGLTTKVTKIYTTKGTKHSLFVSCSSFLYFVLFVVAFSVTAAAQDLPKVTGTFSNTTRLESWSYFQPKIDPLALTNTPIGDPDYTFFGDRVELGVRVAGSRFDLSGAFNYVRLENLPTNAIGPGGLGTGAFYFAASGVRYSYQLYVGELSVKVKAPSGASLTVGRMPYASGGEAVSGNAAIERLKSERLTSRLIGNFEWSHYQRRFDGVRADIDRPRWHFSSAALLPTQGGFEESTNLTMPKIQLGSVSLTHKSTDAEWQGFGYLYRDRRGEAAVVDNSFSLDRPVDVTIATFGASFARVTPTRAGELDAIGWAAVQAGDWYGRDHRGGSVAVEGGHRWTGVASRPWVRGGYLWASGDRNQEDGRHGTFFQMIPSSRKYALSSVYAQMNLSDAFAQLSVEPRRLKARIEVHALRLASGGDLWYQGSGATASKDRYFGFSARAAAGHRSIGTVIEGSVDVPIKKYWSINGYAALMSAGDVVRQSFTNKHLTFWSVENVVKF